LANALRKIKSEHVEHDELKKFNKETAPLFISDPFKRSFTNLFATHPPIDSRIQRLEAM
jgi:heat shock protein HtpX